MRIEVRSINKSLKAINGGVYVSAVAIIIVALLLILLLYCFNKIQTPSGLNGT